MGIRGGIRYVGKHSYNTFGATLSNREIGLPKRNRATETVPLSNVEYDFSALLGSNTYSQRTLKYEFSFLERNRTRLEMKAADIINWLENTVGEHKLYDDIIPLYHFRATVAEVTQKREHSLITVTATFTAYPFRVPNNPDTDLTEVI